jgi:hypothetical protein
MGIFDRLSRPSRLLHIPHCNMYRRHQDQSFQIARICFYADFGGVMGFFELFAMVIGIS